MLKLALIGYGKMGRNIHRLANDNDCEIVAIVDPYAEGAYRSISELNPELIDVCIDFSNPDSAFNNIKAVSDLGLYMVVGTTGWHDQIIEVKQLVKDKGFSFIYGSNFSVGMNIFYKIIDESSRLFNKIKHYDVYGLELHHKQKLDSPSGTAKELAQIIVDNTESKEIIYYDRLDRLPLKNELHFASVRAGKIPGTHEIGFDSEADTIELKHIARNRDGFALGALLAAKWVYKNKGFFNFKDVFGEILNAID